MSVNIIKINRGDSFEFSISIPNKEDVAKKYILKAQDVLYFGFLYPHQRFEEALLIKGYKTEDQDSNSGEISIKVAPDDTRDLTPGVYYYAVKLYCYVNKEDIGDLYGEVEEVRTIIERTKFIINE